jgi:hypothetical protein
VGRSRLAGLQASGRRGRVGGPLADFARWAAATTGLGLVFSFLFFLAFQNQLNKQSSFEFKPRFESNTQKQCTSMNATVNSYIL